MTDAEFNQHMNRLMVQFNKQNYSTERTVLIADAVMHLPVESWKRIVDRLIGEYRQAPLLPEIREAVGLERERNWQSQKVVPLRPWASANYSCACKGTGAVLARRLDIESDAPYAFACSCDLGAKYPAYPKWSAWHRCAEVFG